MDQVLDFTRLSSRTACETDQTDLRISENLKIPIYVEFCSKYKCITP